MSIRKKIMPLLFLLLFVFPVFSLAASNVTAKSHNGSVTCFQSIKILNVAPGINISSKNGKSGSSIIISGSNFQSYESGYLYFDANNNGFRESGEASTIIHSSPSGRFQVTVTVPSISAGTYNIRYSGISSVTPVSYTILSSSSASLSIYSTSGNQGSPITVNGTNFLSYESGTLYLDSNNNGIRDSGEAYTITHSSYSGSFTASLTVSSISAGTYKIKYSGKSSVTPVSYTVLSSSPASLTIYPTSGKPGSAITVSGSDFSSNKSGYLYFDTNNNGIRDSGEASAITNSAYSGIFTASLTVPRISAGTYKIRYSGKSSVTPVSYTVLSSSPVSLTIYSTSGKQDSPITINGTNFLSYESGILYFDSNNNGMRDSNEAYTITNSAYSGIFTASLTVPRISAGTYKIRYSGKSSVAPVSYTVLSSSPASLTIYPTSGKQGSTIIVSGSNFSSNESGYLYFDTNNNGIRDSGEAYTITNSAYSGSFAASLTVPRISAGTYKIRYSGKSSVTPVNYTVLSSSPASLTIYSTSGKQGSSFTVYGSNFQKNESGYLYFDTNNNGIRDSGEAYTPTYSDRGSFTASLMVPSISTGTYKIRYSGKSSVTPVSYTVLSPSPLPSQSSKEVALPKLPYIKPMTNSDSYVEGRSLYANHEIVVKIGDIVVARGFSGSDKTFKINLGTFIVPGTKMTVTETTLCNPNYYATTVENIDSSDLTVGNSNQTGPKPVFNNLTVSSGYVSGTTDTATIVSAYTLDGQFHSSQVVINSYSKQFLLRYYKMHTGTNIYITFVKPYGQAVSLTIASK